MVFLYYFQQNVTLTHKDHSNLQISIKFMAFGKIIYQYHKVDIKSTNFSRVMQRRFALLNISGKMCYKILIFVVLRKDLPSCIYNYIQLKTKQAHLAPICEKAHYLKGTSPIKFHPKLFYINFCKHVISRTWSTGIKSCLLIKMSK